MEAQRHKWQGKKGRWQHKKACSLRAASVT